MDARNRITHSTGLAYKGLGELDLVYYQRTAGSGSGRLVEMMEAGRVLRAVDDQPAHIRLWLLLAYGVDPVPTPRDLIDHLWPLMDKPRADNGSDRFLSLMIEEKSRIVRGRSHRSQAALAAELGIRRQNWAKRWRHAERRIMQELSDIDHEGLSAVESAVRK